MATFLFDKIIFGPVKSRRFGISLGVNLLPLDMKYCSFDCVYCECGLTYMKEQKKTILPLKQSVIDAMNIKFNELKNNNIIPDSITFAGNGEPTLHPYFDEIIDETIRLRNKYFANSKITVLSNSTTLGNKKIRDALTKIDNNVLKLDAGSKECFSLINRSNNENLFNRIVKNLINFKGNIILQTLFLKGNINNIYFDNTSELEVNLWLNHVRKINPKSVMIYSLDRDTPLKGLEKIEFKELNEIAILIRNLGVKADVY